MTTTHGKTKYFLYARKSSDDEDRQVQSIDDQLKCLKEMATILNLEIKEVFTESKSAKKPYNRPVFTEMMKRIEKGEADGILCWKLNRLARNPVDGGSIIWLLQNSIIKHIKSIDGSFTPTDNVLLISVEFGIANQYIIDLRRDCRRGMEGRAQRGWFPTLPPAGYMNDKENKTVVIDTERFQVIRKMWDLMLTGSYTPQRIRTIANDQWGFRTRQFKRNGGVPIANCTIYKLFTNIFYTGLFEWGGKMYNGKHTPMITLEEFDRVQTILGKNGRPRPIKHEFAYTGLLRCGECDCMITASEKLKLVKKTNTLKPYVYYHCTKKRKAAKCSQKPVTLIELEKQIKAKLEAYSMPAELLNHIRAAIKKLKDQENHDAIKIHTMQEQSLAKTENELANLTRMRYRELIDDETFLTEQTSLQGQIARLKRELQQLEGGTTTWLDLTEKAFAFATYAKDHFLKGSVHERKEVLLALGSNFHLKDKKLIIDNTEWLNTVEKCLQPTKAAFKRLEPEQSPYFTTQDFNLEQLSFTVRSAVEDVRTTLSKSVNKTLDIPYISQVESQNGITPIQPRPDTS